MMKPVKLSTMSPQMRDRLEWAVRQAKDNINSYLQSPQMPNGIPVHVAKKIETIYFTVHHASAISEETFKDCMHVISAVYGPGTSVGLRINQYRTWFYAEFTNEVFGGLGD